MRTFSNSNWQYYNLSKEDKFLSHFAKVSDGRIILKTKNTVEVQQAGLIPGESIYELKKIMKNDQSYIVVMSSPVKNQWTGNMSVIDKEIINIKDMLSTRVALEKDILMKKKDFFNLFSCAYVTSARKHSYSNYYLIDV